MAEITITGEIEDRKQVKMVRDPSSPGAPPEPREYGTPLRVLKAAMEGSAPDCVIINGVPYTPNFGR